MYNLLRALFNDWSKLCLYLMTLECAQHCLECILNGQYKCDAQKCEAGYATDDNKICVCMYSISNKFLNQLKYKSLNHSMETRSAGDDVTLYHVTCDVSFVACDPNCEGPALCVTTGPNRCQGNCVRGYVKLSDKTCARLYFISFTYLLTCYRSINFLLRIA